MGRFIAWLLSLGGLLFFVVGIFFVGGAILWPYTINTWLIHSGKEPCIEWWMGGFMAFVPGIGQSCIFTAFITFVLMLFL